MYFGTQEIDSVDGNIVTLKSGSTITVSEKEKELFTEEAITGSDLQDKIAKATAKDIIDVFFAHNIRIADINQVMNYVSDSIAGKNDEATVKAFGEDKLNNMASVYGATEKIASISIRNIRFQDIFNS